MTGGLFSLTIRTISNHIINPCCRSYRRRVLRMLPDYFAVQIAIALWIDHQLPINHPLRDNHDTCMEYCQLSLPLNFLLSGNFVGFGGCGVVRMWPQRGRCAWTAVMTIKTLITHSPLGRGQVYWSVAVQMQLFFVFPLLLAALRRR